MKKKQLVCSALAAAMMLSTTAPMAGAAGFSDSTGHWGESSIDRWSNSGVISGTDGSFNPNGMITRGEMASILAEMLGLEKKADNVYPDLNGGWYTDAMLKCAAAGIMTGDDHGMMRPYDNITGAEIAVIFTKALDLNNADTGRPSSSTGYVKPWAQSYVNTLASRGIAVGNDGGTFEPMQNTSRAAVISMLDRAVDTYISSPGTYTARGLTLINTDGTVTLKGSPTSIDISESSQGTKVTLDHTNVSGTIRMKGSRVQLTADHATLSADVQVSGYANNVSLEGTTSAGTIQLSSGANNSTVSVASSARAGTINSDASSVTMNISGEVNNIRLSEGATSTGVNVRSGANIQSLTSNANNVTVSGSGTLRRADIYASNNRVTTPGTVVSNSVSTTPSTSHKNSTSSSRYRPYYRRWTYSDRYDVDFYMNDGTSAKFASKRVNNGDRVTDPGVPVYANHIFDGWYYYRYYYGYGYDYGYWYDLDYRYDYDWRYWYRYDDWKWDSNASAYYNSKARVYYDEARDYYFIYNRSTRVKLTESEVRDRFLDYYGYDYRYYYGDGRYYDWDYWYKNGDWKWSASRDAYYNSVSGIYYDDEADYYFVIQGGRRVRLSDSEVRDRYGRYYYDSYYYYGDRYPERWYGGYKKGDSFSFNDRIYGSVDLYAKWRACTDVSTAAELSAAVAAGKTPIQVTKDITVDALKLAVGQELYIKSGVTVTVTDPNFSSSTVGGKVTGSGTLKGSSAVEAAGAAFVDAVKKAFSGGNLATAAWSGTTYTVTFSADTPISDANAIADLQAMADALVKSLPEGATLDVNGHRCTSANEVLAAIGATFATRAAGGEELTLSKALPSSVDMVVTANGQTLNYKLNFVINEKKVATESELQTQLSAIGTEVESVETLISELRLIAQEAKEAGILVQVNGSAYEAGSTIEPDADGKVTVKVGSQNPVTITIKPSESQTPAVTADTVKAELAQISTTNPVEASTLSTVLEKAVANNIAVTVNGANYTAGSKIEPNDEGDVVIKIGDQTYTYKLATPSTGDNAGGDNSAQTDDGNDGSKTDDGNDGSKTDDGNDGTQTDDGNDGAQTDDGDDGAKTDDGDDGAKTDDGNDGAKTDDGDDGAKTDDGDDDVNTNEDDNIVNIDNNDEDDNDDENDLQAEVLSMAVQDAQRAFESALPSMSTATPSELRRAIAAAERYADVSVSSSNFVVGDFVSVTIGNYTYEILIIEDFLNNNLDDQNGLEGGNFSDPVNELDDENASDPVNELDDGSASDPVNELDDENASDLENEDDAGSFTGEHNGTETPDQATTPAPGGDDENGSAPVNTEASNVTADNESEEEGGILPSEGESDEMLPADDDLTE